MSGEIPASVRELVHARSEGWCERCLVQRATQIHHRVARGLGGSQHTPWINDPSNLAHLCGTSASGCHGWATLYPASARRWGWVVHRGVAEQSGGAGVVPVVDLMDRGWWLTVDGEKIRFTHKFTPDNLVRVHPERR